MHRLLAPFLALSLLCACASPQAARRIAPFYRSAVSIRAQLDAVVDTGSCVSDFRLDWEYDGTQSVLRVTEPAALAGVVLRADPDARTMTYDEAVLALPTDDELVLSPLEMLAAAFACWRDEYYTSAAAGKAGELPCVTLIWRSPVGEAGTAEISTVFDAQTLLPLSCEYVLNGLRRLSVRFSGVRVA